MERRKHRTPFTARSVLVLAADGAVVAACETPALARFLVTTANFADDLTAALQLCRGEFEANGARGPAYTHFMDVLTRWEAALRA